MLDKTMSIPSRRRRNRSASASRCSAGNTARRQLSLPLVVMALLMLLTAPSVALYARPLRQIPPQAAPPDVQITEVKAFTADGKTSTEIEIRWTAQVSRLTTIDDFEVLLEVRYSDGSKRSARTKHLKSSARAAILQLASHPRQNSSAILKDFKAAVTVRFRIPSSSAAAQQAQVTRSGTLDRRRAQHPAGEIDAFCINVDEHNGNALKLVSIPRRRAGETKLVVDPRWSRRDCLPQARKCQSPGGHHNLKTLLEDYSATLRT